MASKTLTPSRTLAIALDSVSRMRDMRDGMRTMGERSSEIGDPLAMRLVTAAFIPAARESVRSVLFRTWEANTRATMPDAVPELVIGGGVHAAIYCAARVRQGYPRPLVLESGNPGGAFAVSNGASFRLNSSNRPGLVGLPGDGSALNVLPGAPIQASMISGDEYSTNADLAFVTQVTLAQYADVRMGCRVTSIRGDQVNVSSYLTGRTFAVRAGRIIDARGLGEPRSLDIADGVTVQTFNQFMASFDGNFPLRDLNAVAVVGDGDAARCAIEGLLGIGPAQTMTAFGLDYVPAIDWYSSTGLPETCADWRSSQRGRYLRISSYLPRQQGGFDRFGDRVRNGGAVARTARIRVFSSTRGLVTPSVGTALVNDRTYDRVILATGFRLPDLDIADEGTFTSYPAGSSRRASTQLASQYSAAAIGGGTSVQLFRVGPAAGIEFSTAEETAGVSSIPQNRAAIFRLAPRTAALAASLPDVQIPGTVARDESGRYAPRPAFTSQRQVTGNPYLYR
jgi:hypothetical protein